MFLEWEAKYSVGIPAIDQQHQKLFDLINELNDAMGQRKGKEILEKIFNGLLEYTYVHFTNEEIMLTNHNYPELEIHKREHVRLVSQVVELKQKYEAGELMITLSVMDFLKDWLANHIMGFDQKYSPFIKE